ncbi:alpha/beta hydrolase [Nocardia sp. NEAU-G5]|uniref:Alpha/beta hydrolase n=1 Tax=Nocardia albiluteola TaxID=2842303 RepID=A0ABS6AW42_9NOCA|nr:alpha/beta hydrolase [Nocardia albiluteola]MBU3061229.1 alpha/beta hydrolase [Nocardia albiluteola]
MYVDSSDGTRIHYTEWGESADPALVLIHSWGASAKIWEYLIPGFVAAGWRCIAFDRRGHGRSDIARTGYDLDTLAGDLAALLERLDLTGAVLVGQSLGAAEAIRYLSVHGADRVAGLVLSAPTAPSLRKSPDNPAGLDDDTVAALRQLIGSDMGTVAAMPTEQFLGPGHRISPLLDESGRRHLMDLPVPVLLATFDTNTDADLTAELPGITVPTLILQGDLDVNNPIEATGRRCAQLIPHARLVEFEGAGHGVYLSGGDRYRQEILAFTGEVQAAPAGRR